MSSAAREYVLLLELAEERERNETSDEVDMERFIVEDILIARWW